MSKENPRILELLDTLLTSYFNLNDRIGRTRVTSRDPGFGRWMRPLLPMIVAELSIALRIEVAQLAVMP